VLAVGAVELLPLLEEPPMFGQFLLSGFWVEPPVDGAVVDGAVVDGAVVDGAVVDGVVVDSVVDGAVVVGVVVVDVWAQAAAPPPMRAPVIARPPTASFIRSFIMCFTSSRLGCDTTMNAERWVNL